MSRPSSQLSDSLNSRYKQLNQTRKKAEDLFASGAITYRVLKHMYEGLFLTAHNAFEAFIEDLFIGLLVDGAGYDSGRSDIRARFVIRSHKVARELIIGPRKKYIDWLPFNHTKELAKVFFRGGRPFTDIDAGLLQMIKKSVVIRNAIAHNSRQSQDRFFKEVVGGMSLPPRQKNVVGFLRDIYASSPPQSRYEMIVSHLNLSARKLAS